ncbi:hypothetical protein [Streptomyces caatingaensis]|uniref:Resolvase/invertase-type recombinase catalytic domain-containing protein n=1 Tax=Streptomyces caatingaensis TaxID=1678637 RepID=A0A0K9XHX1_9ACTN|nr:hypothetical protein [Streptomyces caatingaensis]KNB52883.1 hypothetical protein AC230_09640 [Streptomyces caatingaensis]
MTDLARRRNIANASSGYDEIRVVLYTLIHDDSKPDEVMQRLRRHAEARDWVVHEAFVDFASLESTRTDRKCWPKAERLLKDRAVQGLVARSEDELAFYRLGKDRLRNWLLELPAFAKYVGEGPQRAPADAPSGAAR